MSKVTVELTGDEAKLFRSYQKIIDQQAKMEAGEKKVGNQASVTAAKLEKVGQKGKQAFGSSAVGSLAKYAAGVVSIGAATQTAIRALNEMAAISAEAGQRARESRRGVGSLAQLARSPEEMQALHAAAKQTFAEGGADTEDEAARTVFAIKSAGGMKHRKMFSQLKATGLVETPDLMARGAATMQASMGKAETGDMRALVSKAFGASQFSPSSAEELLEAASRSGTAAAAMGFSDEELLAAAPVVATAKGGAEMGGTYLAQMMRTLKEKNEFKGMTLKQSVQAIKAKGMTPEQTKKWFGRSQGQEAYELLAANMPMYDKALSEVNTAQATDRVGIQLGLSKAIPSLDAANTAQRAQANRELSEEGLGTSHNLANAVLDNQVARMRKGGSWRSTILAWRAAANTSRKISGDDQFLADQLDDPDMKSDVRRQVMARLTAANYDWNLINNAKMHDINRETYRRNIGDPDSVTRKQMLQQLEEMNNNNRRRGNPTLGRPDQDKPRNG